jgi:hypothetical protein
VNGKQIRKENSLLYFLKLNLDFMLEFMNRNKQLNMNGL